MNSIDLILFILIAIGFVIGLFKGLVRELASLAAIVLGIWGAKIFSVPVTNWLLSAFNLSPKIAVAIAYLVVFLAFVLVLLIVAHLIEKLFSAVALGGLNKFFGGLFGAFKYMLIISVLLNVFEAFDKRFSIVEKETKEDSIGYEPLLKLGPTLWDETMNKRWENKQNEEEKSII